MAIIAISQQIGSRGSELGKLAAAQLGYRFIGGGDLIAETSRRYNVTPELLGVVDERQPHFWERLRTDSERLLAYARAVTLAEMADDRVVVVGRWPALIVPAGISHALRVRTVGPLAERAEQVAREEKLDRFAAERRVREADRELRARVQSLIGVDIDEPSHYDLLVNTFGQPLEALSGALSTCAVEVERRAGPRDLQRLRDAAITAQVRAAMLAHPKIGHAHIDVTCSNGVVNLEGAGLVPPWDELVRQVAGGIEGVVAVEVLAGEPVIPPPRA